MYSKKWRHTKKALSILTAVTMLSSAMGTTAASASVQSDIQPVITEESEQTVTTAQQPVINTESDSSIPDSLQPVAADDSNESGSDSLLPVITDDPDSSVPDSLLPVIADDSDPTVSDSLQPAVPKETAPENQPVTDGTGSEDQPSTDASGSEDQPSTDAPAPDSLPATGESGTDSTQLPNNSAGSEKVAVPTAQEAYDKMIALKDNQKYAEGVTWTNSEPYTMSNSYTWKGGPILGSNGGVGCAAFAFILSDEAFGELPARQLDVAYDNVNVGDILRINGNTHSVIVLRKNAAGVTIAEANYNKTVHWGRTLSKAEVEQADYLFTRYPAGQSPSDTPEDTTPAASGNQGTLTWTLTNSGTLTISGSGAIEDFTPADQRPTWETNNNGITINTIVIEKGITSIGAYAFDNSQATSVYIPDSVTSIGQYAFYKSQLLSVTIPGSVQTIGTSAFQACTSLISVTVSEGVKTIGDAAFTSCTSLKYIDFPASITSVGAGAFAQCNQMTRVRFMPSSEKVSIGDNLFEGCQILDNVTLPEKANCISAAMFSNCKALYKLYIPAGIEEIKFLGVNAPFQSCPSTIEINFAGSRARWDELKGDMALNNSGCTNATVNCDVPFPNPFTEDSDNPSNPDNPDNSAPGVHEHNWSSTDWGHDDSHHWHKCTAPNCPITNKYDKDGCEPHDYVGWFTEVSPTYYESGIKYRECTVCLYRQIASIPALGSTDNSYGSWGNQPTAPPTKPVTPPSADSDVPDDNTTDTDPSPDNNTTGDPSGNPDDSDNSEVDNSSDSSSVDLKQVKKEFRTQLKTGLKEQIKPQLKTMLKKQFKSAAKLKSKAKLKKQLKSEIKPKLRAAFKKQLKKEFGEDLGKEFLDYFNEQFDIQFDKLYTEYFNAQYKQLSAKQKKK